MSLLVCAVGLAPIFAFAGPALAVGYWLYAGETEPSTPELAFPWLGVLPLVLGSFACVLGEVKTGQRWLLLLGVSLAIIALLVGATHMVGLVASAAP